MNRFFVFVILALMTPVLLPALMYLAIRLGMAIAFRLFSELWPVFVILFGIGAFIGLAEALIIKKKFTSGAAAEVPVGTPYTETARRRPRAIRNSDAPRVS